MEVSHLSLANCEQLAQEQTAQYEYFLGSLKANILSIKASGAKLKTPQLDKARAQFNHQAVNIHTMLKGAFYDRYNSAINGMDELLYMKWLGEAEMEYTFALDRILSANRTTYLAALSHGGAFGGLSDLLKDMHGGIGYLVQEKAQEIKWNVRLSDGRTVSSLKLLYTVSRQYAYRLYAVNHLLMDYDRKVEIRDKDDKTLVKGLGRDILKNYKYSSLFKYGGGNYFVV